MATNRFKFRIKDKGSALRVNLELVWLKWGQHQSPDKCQSIVVTALAVACVGLVVLLLVQTAPVLGREFLSWLFGH